MSNYRADRCPGGYLKNAHGLCGRGGNKCHEECAFAYRVKYSERKDSKLSEEKT